MIWGQLQREVESRLHRPSEDMTDHKRLYKQVQEHAGTDFHSVTSRATAFHLLNGLARILFLF